MRRPSSCSSGTGSHATVIGRHGGGPISEAASLGGPCALSSAYARRRDFDLALAHGSHELTITARRLGIPSATTHDYEYATLQHISAGGPTKVVVPEAIPLERMARFGVHPPSSSTRA